MAVLFVSGELSIVSYGHYSQCLGLAAALVFKALQPKSQLNSELRLKIKQKAEQ